MKPSELRAIFAKNLRMLRKDKDMTQAELADLIGIKQPSIAALEAAEAAPSFETLVKVAEIFKTAPDVLLRADTFVHA